MPKQNLKCFMTLRNFSSYLSTWNYSVKREEYLGSHGIGNEARDFVQICNELLTYAWLVFCDDCCLRQIVSWLAIYTSLFNLVCVSTIKAPRPSLFEHCTLQRKSFFRVRRPQNTLEFIWYATIFQTCQHTSMYPYMYQHIAVYVNVNQSIPT